MVSDPTEINALLGPLRREIDAVDDQIIALLAQRDVIVRQIARLKRVHGIAASLPDRIDKVKTRMENLGAEKGLDPALVRELYTKLIDAAVRLEEEFDTE